MALKIAQNWSTCLSRIQPEPAFDKLSVDFQLGPGGPLEQWASGPLGWARVGPFGSPSGVFIWPCVVCAGAWIASLLEQFLDSFEFFVLSLPFWGQEGVKMILTHRAPSNHNMSSYRPIWTHFGPNSMIFEQIKIPKLIYLNFQTSGK